MRHQQWTDAFEGAHTALAGLQKRDSYPLTAHGDPLAHRHGISNRLWTGGILETSRLLARLQKRPPPYPVRPKRLICGHHPLC